ncbi:hypothetical protein L5515_002518 [Caenorhabditis briggsae]|uniref:Uncharacterized protein n=1 Tax=Caenorhabditis briggsae TaxID=6238 RepID=A0AAE9E4A1_CAEBR|nr:hypothetical protein L5515_002518 [Caenorhabditis briggsae]
MNTPTSSSRASGSNAATQLPTTPSRNSGGSRHSRGNGGQRTPPQGSQLTMPRQQQQQRKALSASPQSVVSFASSSICSSPSARNVPLPPLEWLNKLSVPSDATLSRPSSAISMSSSTSSESPSPVLQNYAEQSEKALRDAGLRVCPLQLIAAVASA